MSGHLRVIALITLLVLLVACGADDDPGPGATVEDPEETTVVDVTPDPADDGDEDEGEGDDPAEDEVAEPVPDPCDDPPEGEDHIIVTEPGSGDEVGTTFTVEGCSSTHEGNVIWELLDEDGEVLAEGFTMGGAMGRSDDLTFEVDYELDSSQDGLLRVYAEDARDGSEQYVNEIELILSP